MFINKSMSDLLPLSKRGIFGLDIGSSSIKLVEIDETTKGYKLKNLGIIELPGESIVEGSIIDSISVVNAIKDLVKDQKVNLKCVTSSISGHSVIIKKVTFPVMTEEELADSIQWEAERYIPFDINDVNIDFQIMGVDSEGQGRMEVLLVACKKVVINDYTNVIVEAGLKPVVLDIDAFALENMFEVNYAVLQEENIALVNIGASIMNINILKGGQSAFTRDIPLGGYSYTEEIQKEMQLNFNDAEALKLGKEINGKGCEDASSIIRGVSKMVAQEVKRTLDFFLSTSEGGYVTKICLNGGSSSFSDLPATIHEETGVVVEKINPFNNLKSSRKISPEYLEEMIPFMGVGVGLAIRRLGDR